MNDQTTTTFQKLKQGNQLTAEELLPLVYEELRKLAAARIAREPAGQTLQPTALVHEAWLRLNGDKELKWDGRGHFFAAAAEAMRRILIDNARRKKTIRHGGGQQATNIENYEIASASGDDEMLAVHDALDKLATQDTQMVTLVKLRFFVGLTNKEAAEALGLSEPTAERRWTFARAWLYREINCAR